MPRRDFFARMRPGFAQQAGAARVNADRQADVELLVAKAEYEFHQVRRELVGLVEGAGAKGAATSLTAPGNGAMPPVSAPAGVPAKAA